MLGFPFCATALLEVHLSLWAMPETEKRDKIVHFSFSKLVVSGVFRNFLIALAGKCLVKCRFLD